MINPWVTPDDLGSSSSSPFAYEACQTASYLLWSLSGRRYQGVVTVTEVYEYPQSYLNWPYRPVISEGDIYNVSEARTYGLHRYNYGMGIACGCADSRGQNHLHLRLRGRPIRAIHSIVPGNAVDPLDPEDYWLENKSVLAVNGCRTLEGAYITYSYGAPLPTAGRRAARYLAEQLVKSWEGSDECELPERVTSVTRQGVSYQLLDQGTLIDDMRTGVYAVDLFLKAANPDNARRRARVFSPDVPSGRRVSRHTPTADQIGPWDLQLVPGQPFTWTVDLAEVGGGLLDGLNYQPRGQISNWNGATTQEYDAEHFTVADGILTCKLTAGDTQRARLIGQGIWDLYAVQVIEPYTFIHLMTSNVWLVPHRAAVTV
jgi:hypothetical protein